MYADILLKFFRFEHWQIYISYYFVIKLGMVNEIDLEVQVGHG